MQNVHLRETLERVAAAVRETLRAEGFVPAEAEGGPDTRTVALYAADGWVGLADDPFASTSWGAALSRALGVPVIAQGGERDHAFYSFVSVYERGELLHMSAVPADVTHGPDGRYRIAPRFLAKYVPAAAAAIERGLVVEKLGGEPNVRAVGEALGIPRPLFGVDEGDAQRLFFRFEAKAAPAEPARRAARVGFVDALLDVVAADLFSRRGPTSDEPSLEASPAESDQEAFCGTEHRMHATFHLVGGERVRGVVVRVTGSGLALFDVTTMTAETRDGLVLHANAELDADGRARVFRFPDVELCHAARARAEGVPLAERLRQRMRRLTVRSRLDDPAQVTVRVAGQATKLGRGTFLLTGALANGATATSEHGVRVKPTPRWPVLPAGLTPNWREAEDYAARDVAIGWVGFDGAWSELREVALAIAEPTMRALLEASGHDIFIADVMRRGGEHLEHPDAKMAWSRIEAELARGADVSLRSPGDPFAGPMLTIRHQPDGPNAFAGVLPLEERRPPSVEIFWACPRPRAQDDRDLIADLADFMLKSASASAAHVGGVAVAQRHAAYGQFETSYESLAGTRLDSYDVRWLRVHARAPGFRVLVPAAACGDLASVDGVTAEALAHGVLLSSSALDPFVYSAKDAEAMERAVLAATGVGEAAANG